MLFSESHRHYRNWAGTIRFSPRAYHSPKSIEDLARFVRRANRQRTQIRVIGSGHSFTPVAKCEDSMISLDGMQGLIKVDREKKQATFWGGTKLSFIGAILKKHQLALPNMGDIDKQSIAGAIQTGTHGTGLTLSCLSAFVVELTLMNAHGELIVCNRTQNHELFTFARLSLGTLGIVVTVTMQCVDHYVLEDRRFSLAFHEGVVDSAAHARGHRHFEFFWFPFTDMIAAKALNVVSKRNPRGRFRSYINDHVIENTLYQGICSLAYRQPWLTKSINQLSTTFLPTGSYADDSFRVFPTERKVIFSEMEFAVPMERGALCLFELKHMLEQRKLRIFLPIEYRFVARDDIPLSPFFKQDCVTISLHAYKGLDEEIYFRSAQEIFLRHGGRPHWGKVHYLDQFDLEYLYPSLKNFRSLRHVEDPNGIFFTPYLRNLFGD